MDQITILYVILNVLLYDYYWATTTLLLTLLVMIWSTIIVSFPTKNFTPNNLNHTRNSSKTCALSCYQDSVGNYVKCAFFSVTCTWHSFSFISSCVFSCLQHGRRKCTPGGLFGWMRPSVSSSFIIFSCTINSTRRRLITRLHHAKWFWKII